MQTNLLIQDISMMFGILLLVTLLVKPLGRYIWRVLKGKRNLLTPLLSPIENLIYRFAGINPEEEMTWKEYALAILLFNGLGFMALFCMLLFQGYLPLNPQHLPGLPWDLSLNTAISFVTNTNWQNYAGESSISYFTQMAGFAVQNFLSAATGICIMISLVRGFARKYSKTIGNFWTDLTKSTLYILLPLSIILAIALVSQGVIQNFSPYVNANLIQPYASQSGSIITQQTLPMGPVASQEAIKELGTNGGGFFNANSAHPFENPTALSNLLEILAILLIPAALTYAFGKTLGDTKQGWALFSVMMIIFIIALSALYLSEVNGNPLIEKMGIAGPYLEGKDLRFGIGGSSLFATSTTAVSCGAVNSMHDSLMPLSGLVTMVLIAIGEVVFGGIGSGLYTMLAFVIIAVFVAGLMIGRMPDYVGKKIEPREMWMSVVIILTPGVLVLVFLTIALILPAGVSSILNPGAHGLSELMYAVLSMANNNGSAFAGLNANSIFFNLAGAIVMLIGRFVPAIAALAMAGGLALKKYTPPSAGTLPTHGVLFIVWLVFIVIIVGALSFFPAFVAGPIIEHILMMGGG